MILLDETIETEERDAKNLINHFGICPGSKSGYQKDH